MMKLSLMKDVFKTVNSEWDCGLAVNLIKNWNHDENWIKMWRASANFICFFRNQDKNYIARFNKDSERSIDDLNAEIDLLNYLNTKGISIAKPIISNKHNFIEKSKTLSGVFYTVVFERIFGKQKEINDLKINNFFKWGNALGKFHKAIKEIPTEIKIKRKTHEELFNDLIIKYPPGDAIEEKEIKSIKQWFSTLTKNNNNYGIIHYDFELDNIIWTNDDLCIIDFDDSIYSWFIADIAYALKELFNEGDSVNIHDKRFLRFIEGYRETTYISDEELHHIHHFYRLYRFISYKRLQRSIDLKIGNDNPEWMNNLIKKLTGMGESYYHTFNS